MIGFMGVGKTAVGRYLAVVLNRRFVDLDAEVERVTGLSIPEIFSCYGESWFREQESRTLARMCRDQDQVIATGGGAVLRPENAEALRQSGVVVWLKADPEAICRRVGSAGGRPLLAGGNTRGRIRKLLAEREPCYRGCAHLTVDTTGRSVEEVAAEITCRLGLAGGASPGQEEEKR